MPPAAPVIPAAELLNGVVLLVAGSAGSGPDDVAAEAGLEDDVPVPVAVGVEVFDGVELFALMLDAAKVGVDLVARVLARHDSWGWMCTSL